MDNILKITRQVLLKETAGISFIVRKWAKILEKEVDEQLAEHRKTELAKIEAKKASEPQKPKYNKDDDYYDLNDPFGLGNEDDKKNDPFYWEDETSKGKGSRSSDEEEDWYYNSNKKNDKSYYKKNYNREGDNKEQKPLQRSRGGSFGNSYTGFHGGGGYGNYTPAAYIPPLEEVVIYGDSFPEEYKEFGVDMWVLKNSSRIEYDHWKSGYSDSGEYIVYLNIPLSTMSSSAFIHEIKHAYDDWNRMRNGGKPIRDSWEIKNIYTKDFEKLILGGGRDITQLYPIVRNYYLGSKLEYPAYLENEKDNAMDYQDVGRKLMNFKVQNYVNKEGQPAKGLEQEFKNLQKYDIPLFKTFKNVVDFLKYTQKYFNERGHSIFTKVNKMRYVHGLPAKGKPEPRVYTPQQSTYTSSYTPKKEEEEDEHEVGGWKYTKENGWVHNDDEKKVDPVINTDEEDDFEEGEEMGGWKYSKERGWYQKEDEDDLGNPY